MGHVKPNPRSRVPLPGLGKVPMVSCESATGEEVEAPPTPAPGPAQVLSVPRISSKADSKDCLLATRP